MKKQQLFISLLIFCLLLIFNWFRPIIEFKSNLIEIIAELIVLTINIFLLIKIYQNFQHKSLRLIAYCITSLITILSLLNISVLLKENNSRYESYEIVSENKFYKKFNQMRETSGSIYDYRTRIIYLDNNFFTLGYTIY